MSEFKFFTESKLKKKVKKESLAYSNLEMAFQLKRLGDILERIEKIMKVAK